MVSLDNFENFRGIYQILKQIKRGTEFEKYMYIFCRDKDKKFVTNKKYNETRKFQILNAKETFFTV